MSEIILFLSGFAVGFGFFVLLETIHEIKEIDKYIDSKDVYRCPGCKEITVSDEICKRCDDEK